MNVTEINELIINGNIDVAISEVKKNIVNLDYLNDILLIESNWRYLQSKLRRGLLTIEEEVTSRNRVFPLYSKSCDAF